MEKKILSQLKEQKAKRFVLERCFYSRTNSSNSSKDFSVMVGKQEYMSVRQKKRSINFLEKVREIQLNQFKPKKQRRGSSNPTHN